MLRKAETKTLKELIQIVNTILVTRKSAVDKGNVRYPKMNITPSTAKTFAKIIERLSFVGRSVEFIRSMGLVYLVSIFEGFLQDMLTTLLLRHPFSISDQKSLTANELLSCDNISDAVRKISEKEASIVVNDDIQDVNRYLKGKFHIDLTQLANWSEFKERFYRRNLIIHNSSVVNEAYRAKTARGNVGDKITVDEEYLATSIAMFGTVGENIWKRSLYARRTAPVRVQPSKQR